MAASMDERARKLIQRADKLFEQRSALTSLWQDVADNFYPERAHFTASPSLGEDFAAHLTTSYPILARRDLGNAFGAMLRPRETQWFHMRLAREEREDRAARAWLDWAEGTQKRAMYDRASQFVRATKEGDHDFAAFGQCAITVELNRELNGLLYRCWHLRDVAWCESVDGAIDTVFRRWKPAACDLAALFGDRVHAEVRRAADKDPYREFRCLHVMLPADRWESDRKYRTPWVSLHIDIDNQHVMEEAGSWNRRYVIPRWQTVSGSQYAYSPATVAALPDARLIQAMTLTLLEAGEKAANPPMVATQEAVRSDMQLFAGGVTWVDAEYDERLGEALRPLAQDKSGLPYGTELRGDAAGMIARAFFLDRLNLPPAQGRDMTAFETAQRIQEYIRNALPLFEPMELDYNGALCEETFDLMLRAGGFGSPLDMPPSLRGAELQFKFESPLQQSGDRVKAHTFLEAKSMLAQVADVDPGAAAMLNVRDALRDSLTSIGVPAKWTRDEQMMAAIDQQQQKAQAAVSLIAGAEKGAQVLKSLGDAGSAIVAARQAHAAG